MDGWRWPGVRLMEPLLDHNILGLPVIYAQRL